ncbi:MAG: serine protease [Acidimicrobiia bacterium]|nr:serine protease [Acidimicrobiia bacterium]
MRINQGARVGWIFLLMALTAATAAGPVAAEGSDPAEPRIVGGTVAADGAHPHLVSVRATGFGHICGGSVLTPTVVVTAAHCFFWDGAQDLFADDLTVRAGSNSLNTGGTLHQASELVIHPSYDAPASDFTNDIAVLRLSTPTSVTPVAAAVPGQEAFTTAGTTATVAGWGATSQGGSGSSVLLEADVPVVDDVDCVDAYAGTFPPVLPSIMLCAGFLGVGGVDACQGDSGGPLTVTGPGGNPLLVGVVSFGVGCAQPNFPGVYTRVTAYSSFLAPFVDTHPPFNDDFADAQPLLSPAGTVTGSSRNSTVEPDEPTHASVGGGSSVWYRITPGADGMIEVSTAGSLFDTVLAVYTGDEVGALTEVVANDDAPGLGLQSRVEFDGSAGTTYHVAVDGIDGTQGAVVLKWTSAGADACADPSALFFADVGPSNPFCSEIEWMGTTGLSTGTPQVDAKPLYKPTDAVSRQAMAAFLWRAAGEPEATTTEQFFADVNPSHPFYDALQWMGTSGLSTGTPQVGGKPLYKPTDPVSRQAMAAFLWRAAEEPSTALSIPYFDDVGFPNPFFEAVQWMGHAGVSTGTVAGPASSLFKPGDPVSRQAMGAFLFRSAAG